MPSFISYDDSFFNGNDLRMWAERFSKKIPKNTQILISAGSSGCAIASAILMLRPELSHLQIHPEGRNSHRGSQKSTSGFADYPGSKGVFVDDFMETGATAIKTMETFIGPVFNGKIIGVVLGHSCLFERKIANTFDIPIFFANGDETIKPSI
jgi:phosphoribosylpyrophosphate synthetase